MKQTKFVHHNVVTVVKAPFSDVSLPLGYKSNTWFEACFVQHFSHVGVYLPSAGV